MTGNPTSPGDLGPQTPLAGATTDVQSDCHSRQVFESQTVASYGRLPRGWPLCVEVDLRTTQTQKNVVIEYWKWTPFQHFAKRGFNPFCASSGWGEREKIHARNISDEISNQHFRMSAFGLSNTERSSPEHTEGGCNYLFNMNAKLISRFEANKYLHRHRIPYGRPYTQTTFDFYCPLFLLLHR